jgi:hypothetical protein
VRLFAGAVTALEGYKQPVYCSDPVIAPSGAQFYTGNASPKWRGSLFIGCPASHRLVRLVIKDNRVVGEEHLLTKGGGEFMTCVKAVTACSTSLRTKPMERFGALHQNTNRELCNIKEAYLLLL